VKTDRISELWLSGNSCQNCGMNRQREKYKRGFCLETGLYIPLKSIKRHICKHWVERKCALADSCENYTEYNCKLHNRQYLTCATYSRAYFRGLVLDEEG